MPFYTYSSSWRQIKKAWVYASNAWQPIKKGWVWVSNQWQLFFSGENVPSIAQQVTISQSAPDALDGLITLTGTNYYWTDFVSLTYYFEWSSDGGSTWSTINTGVITNPSSGSSNQKFYTVVSADTSPNIDNLYRFRVFAQNVTLTNNSTSTSTTISTPRNIVWSGTPITSIQYNSATLNFSGGLYSNSYKVRIVNTSDNTTSYQTISGSPGTITSLTQSKNYTVYITGYTSSSAKGYPGNESSGQSFSTPAAPAPIQTQAPTAPTGTAQPFNSITIGSSGSYNNIGNDPGVLTTYLVKILNGTSLTNGGNTAEGTVISSPYTVTQSDATIPKYNFYTRDDVLGLNNQMYYFYSTANNSSIGIISDNFNRNSANGLGVSSSGYDYNSYNINPTTWSTNGSVAVSSQSVPSGATNSTSFAMDTFETNSANISVSMAAHGPTPSGSLAAYGASVWVTAANSWLAVISTYDSVYYSNTISTCTYTTQCGGCPGSYCGYCIFKYNLSGQTCTGSGSHQTTTSSTPDCTGFSGSCGGCTLSSTSTRYNYTKRDTSPTSTTTYTYSCGTTETALGSAVVVVASCNSTNVGSPCSQRIVTEDGLTIYYVKYCESSSTTVTTYACNTSVTYDTSCPAEGEGAGQRCSPCETVYIYNWTYPKYVPYSCDVYEYGVSGTTIVTGYTYNTRLQLVSSASGTVSYPSWDSPNQNGIISSLSVDGSYNSSNYKKATGLYVVASNDTITAQGSNSNNDTFTSLTKTTAGYTKTEPDGSSSAGIIKGYTSDLSSDGRIDSLTIQ